MRKWMALSLGDTKQIARDPMLLMTMIGPFVLGLAFRYGVPAVETWLSVPLSGHAVFLMSVTLAVIPAMIGMLVGFMLLEERDEDVLAFLAVTPLSKTGYLWYRMSMPVVVSFLLSFVVLWITGLVPPSFFKMIPVVGMLALEAPIIALMMAVLAGNKVEGLAVSKVSGVLLMAPVAAYFLDGGWQYIGGVLPTFWAMKAFMASYEPGLAYWGFTAWGSVMHLALLWWLARVFERRSG